MASSSDSAPSTIKKLFATITGVCCLLLLLAGIGVSIYWSLSGWNDKSRPLQFGVASPPDVPPPPPPPPPPVPIAAVAGSGQSHVESLCFDLSGNLWVGTADHGVWRYDVPTKSWKNFTAQDGLADDSAEAIACDAKGRIWVGHREGGISVYNGSQWQNDRAIAPTASAGGGIFDIAVDPQDGDVWIADDIGLSRYSQANDTWSLITPTPSLSADHISRIAFDPAGNLFLATTSAGILTADRGADYQNWRDVSAPADPPLSASGGGLPSNHVYDILIASDSTVYAATAAGLAFSADHGITWQFVRGKNFSPTVTGGILAEDCCTCLGEDAEHRILVSHRDVDTIDVLDPHAAAVVSQLPGPAVARILTDGGALVIGTRDQGLTTAEVPVDWPTAPPPPPAPLPSLKSISATRP